MTNNTTLICIFRFWIFNIPNIERTYKNGLYIYTLTETKRLGKTH